MIQAVIFDMDGLLIDSEPLWQESEKIVFHKVGIQLSDSQVTQTTGLRVDEVVSYWFSRFPWDENSISQWEVERDIIETVKKLIQEKWKAKKWVFEILEFCSQKNIPLAIASSSALSIIETVVDWLDIQKYFSVLYSAEHEKYGKPHPGVYISACEKLGVRPVDCIAFEDSLNGVLAAKSAKIRCIAVPEEINKHNPKFAIADMKLDSLLDFWEREWKKFNVLKSRT